MIYCKLTKVIKIIFTKSCGIIYLDIRFVIMKINGVFLNMFGAQFWKIIYRRQNFFLLGKIYLLFIIIIAILFLIVVYELIFYLIIYSELNILILGNKILYLVAY